MGQPTFFQRTNLTLIGFVSIRWTVLGHTFNIGANIFQYILSFANFTPNISFHLLFTIVRMFQLCQNACVGLVRTHKFTFQLNIFFINFNTVVSYSVTFILRWGVDGGEEVSYE